MKIALIVAISENHVIGRDGRLPWHLPEDLKRFKRLTMGHHLILGRKTFDSIGRLLPGRTTVVLSKGHPELPAGAHLAHTPVQAMAIAGAAKDDQPFVAGGARVYEAFLPMAQILYLTRVHAEVEGDVVFPEITKGNWHVVEEEHHDADERHVYPFTFQVLERA